MKEWGTLKAPSIPVWAFTFSNKLFSVAPFAPTNSQLSLNPSEPMLLLPRSVMSCFASLSNLLKPVDSFSGQFYLFFFRFISRSYFVAGSSKDAINTMDPTSMLFRKVMRGFTSEKKNQSQTHRQSHQTVLCAADSFNTALHLPPPYMSKWLVSLTFPVLPVKNSWVKNN